MSSLSLGAGLAIAGGVGAASTVTSGILGANAATHAADTQAQAAEQAATLQTELGQEGLNLQTEQYNNAIGLEAPAIESGYGGIANLDYAMGIPVSGFGGTLPSAISTPGIPGIAPGGGGGGAAPNLSLTGGAVPPLQNFGPGSRFSRGIGISPDENMVPEEVGGRAAVAPPSSPILNGGQIPLSGLVNPQVGFGSLAKGWDTPFVAPTAAQAEQYPGYQFQLEQGTAALDASAAARGGLITGGEGKSLEEFGQGLAQTDYQNVYNQALQQYQQAYNIFQQNQANTFNRYASLAGIGQTGTGQLNSATGAAGSNIANILLGTGQQVGQDIQNAGAATASGYVGAANAYGGALTGATGSFGNALSLASLLNAYGGGGGLNFTGPMGSPAARGPYGPTP